MLFSCRKYFILERQSRKLPSALSNNCVSINSYLLFYQYLFCIKQANKICTLLSSHLLALIVFSIRCFCFWGVYCFSLPLTPTNPAGQALTSVNFSITKLSDAQRARLNLWWKEVVRELENDQHVSPEANVSRFSFICYSSETGML